MRFILSIKIPDSVGVWISYFYSKMLLQVNLFLAALVNNTLIQIYSLRRSTCGAKIVATIVHL